MRSKLAILGVAWVLLAGCQYGMRRDVLRQQAAEDLSCPAADVTVTHGSEGYRASGCGQDAQYDCPDGPEDMTQYGDRSCTVVRRTVGLDEAAASGAAEQADDDATQASAGGEEPVEGSEAEPAQTAEDAGVAASEEGDAGASPAEGVDAGVAADAPAETESDAGPSGDAPSE